LPLEEILSSWRSRNHQPRERERMTNPVPYLFWITSRAAGIAALVLASLAVCLGLSMQTRLIARIGKPKLRVIHESLSLTSIAAILIHGLTLLGDSYLRPSLLDISVPFVSSYKTLWTTLGILAGWGIVLLGLSYYARNRIGAQRWRTIHRFTALVWLLGLAHSLGEGTDSGQIWFLAMIGVVAIPALLLLIWRISGPRGRSVAPPNRPAAERHTNGRSPRSGGRATQANWRTERMPS
jgi:methionine sulfoxide reductase heme-binding subunit